MGNKKPIERRQRKRKNRRQCKGTQKLTFLTNITWGKGEAQGKKGSSLGLSKKKQGRVREKATKSLGAVLGTKKKHGNYSKLKALEKVGSNPRRGVGQGFKSFEGTWAGVGVHLKRPQGGGVGKINNNRWGERKVDWTENEKGNYIGIGGVERVVTLIIKKGLKAKRGVQLEGVVNSSKI